MYKGSKIQTVKAALTALTSSRSQAGNFFISLVIEFLNFVFLPGGRQVFVF
jgi:hypothetical protein